MRNKSNQIEKEIKRIEQNMKDLKVEQGNSMVHLKVINRKVRLRENLIRNYNKEVGKINSQIAENQDIVESMEQDLDNLRKEYAKMIYYAYKNRNAHSKLMYIFSSDDFTQAYQRMKYLQQISDYRQKQAAIIEKTQEGIERKIAELSDKQKDKQVVLDDMKSERFVLDMEKREQEKVISTLKGKGKKYKKERDKKQEESEKILAAIAKILLDEARAAEKARIAAEKEAGKTPTKYGISTATKLISDKFLGNKGKLPWPVTYYIVSEKFGKHADPLLPGIIVNNKGTDIVTKPGSMAKCVFDGEVKMIREMSGGNVVIVEHGLYFTVYLNLKEVLVKVGDKVETGKALGVIITDVAKNVTEFEFQIWSFKGGVRDNLDPELWLVKK